jgi:hypothetical protein
MRLAFVFLLLFMLQHTCSAQYDNNNKRDSIKILKARYSYHKMTTDKNEKSAVRLPYDTIVFQDVRYDTTFFTMNYPSFQFSNSYTTKDNLYDGFVKGITRYFNNYYGTADNDENKELVCFIKKFSITSQYDFLEHFNSGNLHNDTASQVNIEIECYYKHDDTLYPAVKLDTSYTRRLPNITVSSCIKELLKPLMTKIEQADLERIAKRKAYMETEITKRYTDRFNIPVLTTSAYKKGVYKNFSEFKSNSPSIDSFTIATDRLKVNATNTKNFDLTSLAYRALQKRSTAVFLYDRNNQLISPSEVFGYCDGKTIWIQHGAFFYPLQKISNSFEFMYPYYYNDGNDHTNTMYILSPLNMETGYSN